MKIVFFNRFFFPDTSATSQILSDLAFHLAAKGHAVVVVATHSPDDLREETINGVQVHRVAEADAKPHGLAARSFAYLRYYRGARIAARSIVQPGDIAVIMTDPPMLSAAVGRLARSKDARVVVWLQDLFPEIALKYGVPGIRGPVETCLRFLRDRSLREADAVVAIGRLMAARLAAIPGLAERTHVIENWADGRGIVPLDHAGKALQTAEAPFIVGYSGNFGRVHEFDTILNAAEHLRGCAGVRFVFTGRGPRLEEIQSRVARAGLHNVEFKPHQPRSRLGESLGAADVHCSALPAQFEGLVVPSKVYGVMAAGRPTIFIGDVAGETARILEQADAGISVPTGDAHGLVNAILRLQSDVAGRKRLGINARRAFEKNYDMPIALAKWEELLALQRPPHTGAAI